MRKEKLWNLFLGRIDRRILTSRGRWQQLSSKTENSIMASSLEQAQAARDDKQAEVDDCIAAVDTAKGRVLLGYQLGSVTTQGYTQVDVDAFCLRVLQTYPAAQSSQVIPAEQMYIDAYVALQEAQDELQAAQTLVNQLSSNAGATNADVIQAVESLFQFVNTEFGEIKTRVAVIEERITSNQVVLTKLATVLQVDKLEQIEARRRQVSEYVVGCTQ